MSFEDERIVKMTFDNKAFQKNIESTIRALERLDKSMKLEDVGSSKAFDNFVSGADETGKALDSLEGNVTKVQASFSALQVVGYTVFAELTRYAINAGKNIYNSTLGQIKSGGLSRALNIEAAKFQIEGLGHTWESVYDDINYAVKGTAYGLDSAAKAASQLLASEIKAGDQMKVSLRGISGLAAMTNSSYDDIADIFTTVAGSGRLMGDQLNRISYRGINAAQTLKDYFNNVKGLTINTEKEIRDMVAKGKVSFMDFASAMDYAFGEHAKDANKTFTGAMSNVRAALSRIGEKFLTPWNEFERKLAVSIIPLIDNVAKALNIVLPVFNAILDRVSSWTESLIGNYKFQRAILNVFIGIWSWIQNIIGALYEMGFHLPKVESIADFLDTLTSHLVLNAEQGRTVREVVKTLLKPLSIVITLIQGILYAVKPLFTLLLGSMKQLTLDDVINKINYIIKVVAVLLRMGIEKGIQLTVIAVKALCVAIKIAIGIIGGIIFVFSKLIKAAKLFVSAIRAHAGDILNVIKNIGLGFIKFYELVIDIFSNISDGISDFLTTAQEKTSSLWTTINGLVGNKKLVVDVDIAAKAKQLKPGDIVKKDAVDNVAGAVKNMTSYSSTAKEASKAATTAGKKIGAVGGRFSGALDTPGFSNGIKDGLGEMGSASKEAADQVGNNMWTIAKSVRDMSVDVNKSIDDTSIFGDGSGKKKGKKDKSDKSNGLLAGFLDTVKSIGDKLSVAKTALAEHFGNFYSVLFDVISVGSALLTVVIGVFVVKLIKLIFGVVNMLPQLTSSLSNAAKGLKYKGMGEAFRGFAVALLAFGAVALTVAAISKFVDPEAFDRVAKTIMKMLLVSTALAMAVGVIMSALAVIHFLETLPNPKGLLTRTTGFVNQLKQIFISLAVLIATVLGSILAIRYIAEKDGGYTKLNEAAVFIGTMIIGIGVFMIVVSKALTGLGKVTETTTVSLKGISRTGESAVEGIVDVLLSLVPLILTIVGAAYILYNLEDPKRAIAMIMVVMGSVGLLITGICVVINVLTKRVKEIERVSMNVNGVLGGLRLLISEASRLISAVSLFMLTFAGAAAMLSMIPEAKQEFVLKMMGLQAITLVAILGGLAFIVNLLSKRILKMNDLAKSGQLTASLHHVGVMLTAIMSSMSKLMLSMVGAVALLSIIPRSKLEKSVASFVIMMATMTIAISIIVRQTREFTKIAGTDTSMSNNSITMMKAFGLNLAQTIGAISVMAIAIAGSLAVLSKLDTKSIITSALVLGGMMIAMMVFMRVLVKTFKVTDELNETMNSQASGKNAKTLNSKSKTTKTMTSYMENTGMMILEICGGMSTLVLAISAAIKVMGSMSLTEMLIGLGGFIIAAGAIFGALVLLIHTMSSAAKQMGQVNFNKQSFKFIYSVIPLIFTLTGAIVVVMGAVSYMAIVLDQVKTSSIVFSIVTLSLVFGALMGMVGAITSLANRTPIIDTTSISKVLLEIAMLMSTMAINIMAVAYAATLFQKAGASGIIGSLAALTLTFAAMITMVFVIGGMIKDAPKLDTKRLSEITASMVAIVGSMAGCVMILSVASVLFKYGDPSAAIGAFTKIILLTSVVALIASQFKDRFEQGTTALSQLRVLALSLSQAAIGFSVAALILGKVDWDNIQKHLKGFMGVVLGFAALIAVMSYSAALIGDGVAVIVALTGAVIIIIAAIAVTIKLIAQTFVDIANTLNFMATLDWSAISASATQLKNVVSILASSVSIGLKNIVQAALIGFALKMLVGGLAILQTVDAAALTAGVTAVASAMKALHDSIGATIAVIGLIILTAPSLASAIVILAFAILLILAMIPMIANAAVKATTAIANVTATLKANMITIANALKDFKNVLGEDDLYDLVGYASMLGLLGIEMFVAGVTLAIGTGAFIVGALLLGPAMMILTSAVEKVQGNISMIVEAIDGVSMLSLLGIFMAVSGALMVVGSLILLIGAALMLAATTVLELALRPLNTILSGIITFLDNVDMLALFGVALIQFGVLMLVAGVLMGTAAAFMLPAILLLAGTFGVMYLALSLGAKNIMIAGGLMLLAIGVLSVIGLALIAAAPILIIGGLAMAVVGLLLGVAGTGILIGMASFTLALLAIWGAVLIIQQIPTDDLGEKLLQLGLTIAGFIGIGLLILVAAVVFTIAGVFVLASALLISTAMITFAVTLMVSALAMMAAAYVLQMAFEQFQILWDSINVGDMILLALSLMAFGLLMLIAGVLMTPAGLTMLIGAALISAAATMFMSALPNLKKAFNKGMNGKDLVAQSALFLASGVLLTIAGPLLVAAGGMFVTFGASIAKVAKSIASSIKSLVESADSLTDVVDKFEEAGGNIIGGIKEGVSNGLSTIGEVASDTADTLLDTFCDVLGIHSPAEEFIKAAANIIAGIAEGLGMDRDEVYNQIVDTGMGMLDTFGSMTDNFKDAGSVLADSFNIGFDSQLSSGFNDIAGGFLGNLGDLMNGANAEIYNQQIKAIENQQKVNAATWGNNQWTDAQIAENQRLENERKKLIEERDAMAVQDYTHIADDILTDGWYSGGAGGDGADIDYAALDTGTADALSTAGSGLKKTGSDASSVGGNVGTAVTNNTYNFTQNNYSPEPIDRTELYTQTNNQLDTWYKWLRDNG